MAKCNWKENHDESVKGILKVNGDIIEVEIEDIGVVNFADVIRKFNEYPVAIKVKKVIEHYTAE